jgi:tetratricopeptide (TPR) repeat protein
VTPQPAESFDDLLRQAKALNSQEKRAGAPTFFEQAALRDPNNFDAWFNLSYTRGELKRYAEALWADERPTTLDPNSASAWYSNGLTLGDVGRYEKESAARERALALDPTDPTLGATDRLAQ